MNITINAKEVRRRFPKLVERVRKGARFTVLYRSRPAFQIVPVDESSAPVTRCEINPLYRAKAVGSSDR